MNRILFFAILLLLHSCDDGDLQIETLNFDDSAIQFCGTIAENTTLLFKINGLDALILELPDNTFANEVGDNTLTVSASGQTQVSFRIFSDNVTANYFCDAIPPAVPSVTQEIIAEDGEVRISSTTDDDITFTHSIALSGISLVAESGERITDLRINEFGTVTTSIN